MVMLADRHQTGGMRPPVLFGSIIFMPYHDTRYTSILLHRAISPPTRGRTRHVNSAVDRSTDCNTSSSLLVHSFPLSFPQTTGRFPSELVERNAEEPWHWGPRFFRSI